MAVKFGTSGLRGLVVDMTPDLIADYTRAFLRSCDVGTGLFIGHDLRASSPDMAAIVGQTARALGVDIYGCGALPTPALALAAGAAGAGAIMVTGSHIPADRNGLKFYSTAGEILKQDEQAILNHLGQNGDAPNPGKAIAQSDAGAQFVDRYVRAFGGDALIGRRIGVYTHSAVGRDLLMTLLSLLGADVVELGRSEVFIPVDTEAYDPEIGAMLAGWTQEHGLDAIVSTDGDSDRPMVTDETGQVIAGDILGQITSVVLGADRIVTPISSNSGVLQKAFSGVSLTKIGSPYVIAGMQELADAKTAGYEANGGFLLGYEAQGPAGALMPLMTRDSFLPIVSVLHAAKGQTLSQLVAQEPAVFTAADRLQNIATQRSNALVATLVNDAAARAEFVRFAGSTEVKLDLTDGMRVILKNGVTLHLRPSGNAPELRLYVEASSKEKAQDVLQLGLDKLLETLS